MNPKQTYTSSISALTGQPSALNNKKKKKPVVWGIPAANNSSPSPIGKTSNTTSPYPTGVNSPNPTAGSPLTSSPGATGSQQGSNAPATSPPPATTTKLPQSGQDYVSSWMTNKYGSDWKPEATTTGTGTKTGDDKSAYIDSLKAEQFPTTYKSEQEARDKAAQKLADIQSTKEKMEVEAKRAYEDALDKPGGTVAHARQAAALSRRRSNVELGDVALQESAAARSAQVAQGIFESAKGDDRQLTIEEIQILNEGGANLSMGATISEAQASGVFPSGGGTTEGVSSLAQMVMSGEMDMSGVPADLRGAVAEAVQAGGGVVDQTSQISPYQQERITRNLNSIGDLMGQVSGWNTGMGSLIAAIPGTPAADFRADVNTLAANIAFGELTAMREASKTGGALGQVSERELALLEAALGSLDRAQSPDQFKDSLLKIKESIERWQEAIQQQGAEEGGEGGLYDF